MARIVVDPQIGGHPNLQARKIRRLVYLAWIARDLGHEVSVRCDRDAMVGMSKRKAYNGRSHLSYLNILGTMPQATDPLQCDLLICSEGAALGTQKRPECKVAAWRTHLGGGHSAIKKQHTFDLLCGYAFSQPDWTEKKNTLGQTRLDAPAENPLGDQWFSVPWMPFECTLSWMHEHGLWEAYLRDNLDALRDRLSSPTKDQLARFIGYPWGWRTRISRLLDDDRFEFKWVTCAEEQMRPDDYLRWLSAAKLSVHLPGDTWKCSRFAESVMMGVPVAHLRHVVQITPPMTDDNVVLIDDWRELLTMDLSDERLATIAANADAAYRDGWSLRGQFIQMMKRLGL